MKIKIFKEVNRKAAVPSANLPEKYALTTPEFKNLYNQKGVYKLFLEGQNSPMYIGRSVSDLGRTIARHFQKWNAAELKFLERRPSQLLKMLVEVELMPNANDDEIITRETELIEKFLPTYNLRKGADVHKDPDRYKISEESRALLDMRVKEYEEEQEARAEYEAALREYEEAEAERQAQEEALLQAAEQDAPPQEIAEIKEELQEAKAEVKEAEKELAKVKRRFTFKKNSFKIRRKK